MIPGRGQGPLGRVPRLTEPWHTTEWTSAEFPLREFAHVLRQFLDVDTLLLQHLAVLENDNNGLLVGFCPRHAAVPSHDELQVGFAHDVPDFLLAHPFLDLVVAAAAGQHEDQDDDEADGEEPAASGNPHPDADSSSSRPPALPPPVLL